MFLPLDEREVKDGRGGRREERGGIVPTVEGASPRLGSRRRSVTTRRESRGGAVRRDTACAFIRYEGWTTACRPQAKRPLAEVHCPL
ncbi:MAG: hypothetical protein K0Q94_2616 [Paenibacillus sp.]|jgi:hypothetical protein|nr:hypothetical protein [Paenibacillus sp.]